MRATTLLRRLLGITGLVVGRVVVMITGDLHVEVRPRWRRPRCGGCGRIGPGYDRKPPRRWRHLGLGRTGVYLGCEPRRVNCRQCGIRTEQVPWAAADSRFTWDFEEMVAYLAQITDKTKVTELTGIAWETVGSIVERVVARRLAPDRLLGLRCIGVDEFSYRKRHHYITVVVDHDRRRVVWAAEGRSGDVLAGFFAELGPERCAGIETVTMGHGRRLSLVCRAVYPRPRSSTTAFMSSGWPPTLSTKFGATWSARSKTPTKPGPSRTADTLCSRTLGASGPPSAASSTRFSRRTGASIAPIC